MADDEQETQTQTKPKRGKAKADAPTTQPGEMAGHNPDGPITSEPSVVKEPAPGELDEAIGDLGKAVEREAGNYDLSEEAHRSAIEGAENAASNAVFTNESLVFDARDFLLEQIKRRPKPWGACSGGEKADIAAACEHAGQELVRKIAEEMASAGLPRVRVLLGQIVLGDDIKITGKVKIMGDEDEDAAVLFLHRAQGQFVMVTLASKDAHQEGDRPAPGVPAEEPELSFEAGADEIEDADLAAENLVEQPQSETISGSDQVVKAQSDPLRTGDLITLDDYATPIRVRVNLKTGMIEGQTPNSEAWDIDVREATASELAGERSRTADFDDEAADDNAEQERENVT